MEKRAGAALSPAMKRLGEYMERTDERVLMGLSITQLAEEAGVAEATVLRFCRQNGFEGYSDFRVSLAQAGKVWLREEPNDFLYDIQTEYLAALERCRAKLDGETLKRAYELILSAEKVYCYAVGESASAALWLKDRLLEMGVFAVREEDVQFRNVVIPACGERDLLVTLGGGGETARAAELARAHGMKILALGGGERYADCALTAARGEGRGEKYVPLFLAEILCAGLCLAFPERFDVALAKSACAVSDING